MMNKKQRIEWKFEAKTLTEDGTFEGDLSVYGIRDLGGDIVEKGAFSKSIKEADDGRIPLLYQHDTNSPLGYLELTDTPKSLRVKGTLILDVAKARETYSLMKAGVLKGLSIGYEAIKDDVTDGVRHLKEVKLWEGSIVTFPMLPQAQITGVKAYERKEAFTETLSSIKTYMMRGQVVDALTTSLDMITWDWNSEYPAAADRIKASADAIDAFKAEYLGVIPDLFDEYGLKFSANRLEAKAGRRISAQTRAEIQSAIDGLSALVTAAESTEEDPGDGGQAAQTSEEPLDATLLEELKQLKSIYEVANG